MGQLLLYHSLAPTGSHSLRQAARAAESAPVRRPGQILVARRADRAHRRPRSRDRYRGTSGVFGFRGRPGSRADLCKAETIWSGACLRNSMPVLIPMARYRVNEFYCRSDTWQMTMRQLAANSDAVLMDLRPPRSPTRAAGNQSGQLLDGVPLPQALLIVDATTDQAFLQDKLQSLWGSVAADSPNRSSLDPEVRLYEVHSGNGQRSAGLCSACSVGKCGQMWRFRPMSVERRDGSTS